MSSLSAATSAASTSEAFQRVASPKCRPENSSEPSFLSRPGPAMINTTPQTFGKGSFRISRMLLLRGVGFVYLCAFVSFFLQIDGLFSCNGLLPADEYVTYRPSEGESLLQRLSQFGRDPNILLYIPPLPFFTSATTDATALRLSLLSGVGAIVALFCMMGMLTDCVTFVFLHLAYLACQKSGQLFLAYTWDLLLLEMGGIAILSAQSPAVYVRRSRLAGRGPQIRPAEGRSDGGAAMAASTAKVTPLGSSSGRPDGESIQPYICLFLSRWLLFRLLFASGVLKIFSNDPAWTNLSALKWHFQSQCLPLPASWFAFKLPMWWLQLGVAATFFIQIHLSFLMFFPIRPVKNIIALAQVIMMAAIAMTGNYNWLNVATALLALVCLDDRSLLSLLPRQLHASVVSASIRLEGGVVTPVEEEFLQKGLRPGIAPTFKAAPTPSGSGGGKDSDNQKKATPAKTVIKRRRKAPLPSLVNSTWTELILLGGVFVGVVALFFFFFPWSLTTRSPEGALPFTSYQLRNFVNFCVPLFSAILLLTFVGNLVFISLRFKTPKHNIVQGCGSLCLGGMAIALFVASLKPFYGGVLIPLAPEKWIRAESSYPMKSAVAPIIRWTHPSEDVMKKFASAVEPFRWVNAYGLFTIMTGVGGRPELSIEGYDNERKQWLEYDFIYKPDLEEHRPPFAAPYQPRFDWQMWFAALSEYQEEPWLLHLVYKLLHNDRHASCLLRANPFLGKNHPCNAQDGLLPLVSRFVRKIRQMYAREKRTSSNPDGDGAYFGEDNVMTRDGSTNDAWSENLDLRERVPRAIRVTLWNYTFTKSWRSHEWWSRDEPVAWLPQVDSDSLEQFQRALRWPKLSVSSAEEGGGLLPEEERSPHCPVNIAAEFPLVECITSLVVVLLFRPTRT